MKQVINCVSILLLLLPLIGCKVFESKDRGISELKLIEIKWRDNLKVANATPRIALSAQVSQLQAVRRELTEVPVGKCLEEAKSYLDHHMEMKIEQFLAFMSEKEWKAEVLSEVSEKSLVHYTKSRDACIT